MICNDYLRGACTRANCTDAHTVLTCDTCFMIMSSPGWMNMHLKGKRHAMAVALTQDLRLECAVCPDARQFDSRAAYDQHAQTLGHLQRRNASPVPPEPRRVAPPGHVFCDTCVRILPSYSWAAHLQSEKHLHQAKVAAAYRTYRGAYGATAGEEPDIVRVSHRERGIDFGEVDVGAAGPEIGPRRIDVELELVDSSRRIVLISAHLAGKYRRVVKYRGAPAFTIPLQPAQHPPLRPHRPTNIPVSFLPPSRTSTGRYTDALELIFEDLDTHARFTISRPCSAVVGDLEAIRDLAPSTPYVRPQRRPREEGGELVPGVKNTYTNGAKWVVQLPRFDVPYFLRSPELASNMRKARAALPPEMNAETYAVWWQTLLWFEEVQQGLDMQRFNMESVTLEPYGRLYTLEVPGLAEKRPSVLRDDSIRLRASSSLKSPWYQGYVHAVQLSDVVLRFSPKFSPMRGERWDARFDLRRTCLRRMHAAVQGAGGLGRVIFPKPEEAGAGPGESRMVGWFNRILEGNREQRKAVEAVVGARPGSAPFVIYGPPGTGKTVTAVECIRQLLASSSTARILACAPSNAASDLLASRLDKLGVSQLYRLNAPSRDPLSMPADLKPFTSADGMPPTLEQLKKFRVIVTTCLSASVLSGLGLPLGHFSHVFIDEAGQASEPEVMVPITAGVGPRTNVVLSGDPKQLGPVVRSSVAGRLGLGRSFLERVMGGEGQGEEVRVGFVKLLNNFRSHPAILDFPNKTFYADELVPCADPVVANSLLHAPMLEGQRQYPVVFHAVKGKDAREGRSPSFFNPDEAALVGQYVRELLDDRSLRLKPEYIGVISPYNAQVRKIRHLLDKEYAYKGIKVGVTEDFQGQERRVIIISTVRTTASYLKHDLEHSLGFLANPKRLNVAITRAQALLIIIGDPHVLSSDPTWCALLSAIHLGGGWRGQLEIDWDPSDPPKSGALEERSRAFEMERRDAAGRMAGGEDREEEVLEGRQEDVPWHREV